MTPRPHPPHAAQRRSTHPGTHKATPGARGWRGWIGPGLFAAMLILGGGGQPATDGLIELGALVLIVLALATPLPQLPRPARLACLLLCAVTVAIAVQLVPLPADTQALLPGRDVARAVRDLVGGAAGRYPLTLDAGATWRSALSLLPGIGLFLTAVRATAIERTRFVDVVIALALGSALLGMAQIAGADLYIHSTAHAGYSVGLFVNRNHHADLLLVAMLLTAARMRGADRLGRPRAAGFALLAFLAISTVATFSRGGVALLMPTMFGVAAILLPTTGGARLRFAVGLVLIAAAGVALVAFNPVVGTTVGRFHGSTSDLRFDYWRDTVVAISHYWPAGSGFGTFPPVFASVEDLDTVNAAIVNHAHNDYLELLLEGGIAAAALIGCYLALLPVGAVGIARAGTPPVPAAALVGVLVILLHSAVDYPLRMLSLCAVFGLLNALALAAIPITGSDANGMEFVPGPS